MLGHAHDSSRLFTGHDPARRSRRKVLKKNAGRVGSGRVGSGRVGSGRVGSGRVGRCWKSHGSSGVGSRGFQCHGSGRVTLTRSDWHTEKGSDP